MTTRAFSSDYASMPSRIFAILIDSALMGVLMALVHPFLLSPSLDGLVGFTAGALAQAYFLTNFNGQTPGKMLLGIRIVKVDGSALNVTDALLRYVGYLLNDVLLGIGWLWAFMDKDHQGLHDKIAKTYVVRS